MKGVEREGTQSQGRNFLSAGFRAGRGWPLCAVERRSVHRARAGLCEPLQLLRDDVRLRIAAPRRVYPLTETGRRTGSEIRNRISSRSDRDSNASPCAPLCGVIRGCGWSVSRFFGNVRSMISESCCQGKMPPVFAAPGVGHRGQAVPGHAPFGRNAWFQDKRNSRSPVSGSILS